MKLISIVLLLVLSSCSAQWHIQKAIKKDPSIVQKDTITVIDTVKFITKEIRTDSVFKLSTDTVIIQKDKLTIKHFYNRDSVYLWGECESDTIIQTREVEVPFEKVVYKERFIPSWVWFVLILAIIIFLLRKIFN